MLLNSGKNYEDHQLMNSAIKSVRFIGCSGVVTIESGSNDRRLTVYSLYNNYYNNSTNKWETTEVGHFSPYSGTYFQFTNPTVWPGNSAPSTFNDFKCPFKEKNVRVSFKSKLISIAICTITVIFCILFAFFMIRGKFSYKLENISEQKYFTDPDLWMMSVIFIESLQFKGIGPSFEAFNIFYYDASLLVSYNLDTLLELKDDLFWTFFYATEGTCIFWFLVELRYGKCLYTPMTFPYQWFILF
ncbi:unnamed protein product [Blepharisma stoltei]|uniref:Uncharacterized protein n=1 Tax=Blepharisma stoltei TaxID=1481888 RepID=A0AAU9JBV1_9CILI|nr:unnamed protein product [Blepharisma stoltei]